MKFRPEFETDEFKKGLEIRKAVLGEKAVERSLASATDISAPLQQLVTEYCWGNVWARPGLDRRVRSFLNLAMLTALNRSHELRLHIRGALNNGVTREEIREAFIQAAIYVGVPAALESTRVADEVFRELDQNGS
jgi:4-carboxymuconolactone decarboxylase